MRAVVYTRISEDRSGAGLGVARQERECRELAATRSWDVVEVLTDNDRSAYTGKPRPGYDALLDRVRAGLVDVVVAWHPDRLHRSPKELETFIDLIESAGVTVATVQGGQYDLTTAAGRMTARVVGAVARHESEHKSERHRAKARELARQGKPTGGGTRAFGFEADRISHRDDETAEIRSAVQALLAGKTAYGVLKDWQSRGVDTPTGGKWRPSVFKRMLISPRIAGLREHAGEIVGPAVWKPIISEGDHYALTALFNDPSRRPSMRPRKYLLTGGLARCGLCGENLVARPRADKSRCYVCASGVAFDGCGRIRQLSEPLEEYLRDLIVDRLAGPDLAAAIEAAAGEKDSDALDELRNVEQRMEKLAVDHYDKDLLSEREYMAARAALETRSDALKGRLAAETASMTVDGLPATTEALRERWDAETVEWRRRLVGLVVDRLTLKAAVKGRNFFDPDRVVISWRA